MSELPTGTVTLLLADVEGSTRLWETQPQVMAASLARLNTVVSEVVPRHGGVRPLEQGEGDSFVAAFAKASDAVACALALQRADLGPIKLRIGVHTGEIQLRDDANYAGPTINRTARLRDLAHGGQTVLSGAAEAMVLDRLPDGAWLADLGSHSLRDLPRPERVLQLNHPDLRGDFPPLRVATAPRQSRLPAELTSFVGRAEQVALVAELLRDNRMVTLTGAGGAGKTRLAIRVAAATEPEYDGNVFFVDLAPINNPALVPVTVACALELTEQPGRTTRETIQEFVRDRKVLVLLDNCEHLLEACSQLVMDILQAGRRVTVFATSREPLGIAGELTWSVPSLSIDDDAVALFVDRAQRVRPGLSPTPEQRRTVIEICRRLDGMPLAIELAAARTRTLSINQILDSLRSSFRLLTGGARTAVRRQQTLSASIDWSHSLLTETERILLRRLAVFADGFDLDAAEAVCADTDAERAQLIDVLGLLVEKSLVVADDSGERMRYRLLETVRQYSMEKLAASGEADTVRNRQRDHYATTAKRLHAEMDGDGLPLVPWAQTELDNLRAAFAWSCENADFATALTMVSTLQQFWGRRGRSGEGIAGFEAVFSDHRFQTGEVPAEIWIEAVVDQAQLAAWRDVPASASRAEEALAAARILGDDRLTSRILYTCGITFSADREAAARYFEEALALARDCGDPVWLMELLSYLSYTLLHFTGLPEQSRAAAEEGWRLADQLGDRFMSRFCRVFLGAAIAWLGRPDETIGMGQDVVDEARGDDDFVMEALGWSDICMGCIYTGDFDAGHSAASVSMGVVSDVASVQPFSCATLAHAALGHGDPAAARRHCEDAATTTRNHPRSQMRNSAVLRAIIPMSQAALGCGDLAAARRWADQTVTDTVGAPRVMALATRARVAIAQGEPAQAERDAHEALAVAAACGSVLAVPEALECLAATADDDPQRAARLLGAAHGIRRQTHEARCPVFNDSYDQTAAYLRDTLGENVFDQAWSDGESLSSHEAIAYAQRGRGERKRPTSGWESLTPAELDVVRLLTEGLSNKEIAARLFISPRTAQTHLTHVYSKLGLSSRVQVVQAAARHTRVARK
ncbi:LuxR family transcriptional regulator [Mycolicibacterium pulveris]|uniref:Transcriptional regulator n=1 Tax=Mycolicibacterium pulveris TaxID=36813 RepID=A0A7I7UIQ8_MYCPV|nr:LuxR family transcriptional regulator [Mycolicibacterium pulveris]MCV6979410.1 LuxR family transcriptional regulator [Mycolicibacterium pulveris]BBY81147.1 transcriptional regulator [Mycolicibacterium pulveris]